MDDKAPPQALALEGMRRNLKLNPDKQVRIVFEGDERIPLFECCSCGELMRWRTDQRWWECPSCTYELTPIEAEELLDLSVRRLRIVIMDVRRKQGSDGRWRERSWFYRLLRRFFGRSKASSRETGKSTH